MTKFMVNCWRHLSHSHRNLVNAGNGGPPEKSDKLCGPYKVYIKGNTEFDGFLEFNDI